MMGCQYRAAATGPDDGSPGKAIATGPQNARADDNAAPTAAYRIIKPNIAASEKNRDAWMVQAPRSGVIGNYSGIVACAEKMDRPAYWRE